MVQTLGTQEKCPQKMPFAMYFAGEPAFTTISKQILQEELRYNPIYQINEESRLNLIVAGQTSSSVRSSTTTGWLGGRDDDDSMGDESQ